ncbi:polymorphic toxin-type HINT domain-containing protein [Ureibacillus manganicus]|uniref:polymorphic toxin-type HINT domain-containing protein n=1 Tax=Ureibacillus manganicus TaxID=1266064 RepID=UPI00055ED5E4|nr:polymorphic toxin-type HINT domain-containing protein [Ureibacillus manganicus]
MQIAKILSKEDRHGNRILFEYNNDQLINITSQLGTNLTKSINFTYYSNGLVETAEFEGTIYKYIYDSGSKLKQVDQLKNGITLTTTRFDYHVDNRISDIIDPKNRKTTFTYDNGTLTQVQEPDIKNDVDAVNRPGTKYTLDMVNKIATITEPEGKLTTTYFMNDNYVTEEVESGDIVIQYELDSNYNVTMESVNGYTKRNEYDQNGNLTCEYEQIGDLPTTCENAKKVLQSFTYTTYGNIETYTDSNNKTTTYRYNPKGDLLQVIVPDSNAVGGQLITNYEPDEFGDVNSITLPDGTKESFDINYTALVKSITSVDAFGNESYEEIDLKGNVLTNVNGKKQTYKYEYNDKNELEIVLDPKLKITKYGYDANGNLKTIRNALNYESSFFYNGQNLLKEETNAIGKKYSYDYDHNGNLTNIKLPNNGTIDKKYDDLNRISEVYSSGKLIWKYNYKGEHLESINKGSSLYKTFDYYDNNFSQSIQEGNNSINYAYLGEEYYNQIKYTIGSETGTQLVTILDYKADDLYRTEEIKRNEELLASFEYSPTGLLELIDYTNGSSISMQYDRNRLSNYILKSKSDFTLDSYTFEYDANNNIDKVFSNAGITDYKYDNLNQLEEEHLPEGTSIFYTYDDVGNRKTKTITKSGSTTTQSYVYNGVNQLIKVGNQDYQYDDNGNLSFDGSKTYVFNNFNQLEEIKDNSGKTIVSYTYDEEGKRKSTTTLDGTVNYFYDGVQVLFETDENNQVLREYTYDDFGHPLTMTTNGKTYRYLFNYHGDITALTDENGEVVASYSYDAWGNILSQLGPMASENPYRYAGYRYDENTKLYYLLARYYNPDNGVFLSIDPVRGSLYDPLTINGYNYVSNNPVMLVDPDGDWAFLIPMAVTVARAVVTKVAKQIVKKASKVVKKTGNACNCFIAGTKVLTDEGEKNIEDIEVGDKVLAKDENNPDGELAYKEVTALYRNQRDDIIKLHVGEQIIETTDNHPFWVEGKGWVFADELQVGDKLQKADGSNLTIDKVEFVKLDEPVTVYNFTVEDYHTYYVTDIGIWVHNTNCMDSKSASKIISGAARKGSGLKDDKYHRAASFLSEDQLAKGTTFNVIGKDKISRTLLQVNGEFNGKKGIFEYLIDVDGKVSHQRFKVGGVINGKLN